LSEVAAALANDNCSICQTLAVDANIAGVEAFERDQHRRGLIWLVIMAATFGGPPISLMVSGSMFCLEEPIPSATK
jgi:hypothetical protein